MRLKIKKGKELGHSPAREVKSREDLDRLRKDAQTMLMFMDANNGRFPGNFDSAWAIHHCQIFDDPLNFFIVDPKLVGEGDESTDENERNTYFPSRVIVNPEILTSLPTRIEKYSEEKSKDGKKGQVGKTMAVENRWYIPEGCMSYPHRKESKMPRFVEVKVKYQFLNDRKEIEEKEEVIDKLKAQVFQHEVDHGKGIDIVYGDGKRALKDIPWDERYLEDGKTIEEVAKEQGEELEEYEKGDTEKKT